MFGAGRTEVKPGFEISVIEWAVKRVIRFQSVVVIRIMTIVIHGYLDGVFEGT